VILREIVVSRRARTEGLINTTTLGGAHSRRYTRTTSPGPARRWILRAPTPWAVLSSAPRTAEHLTSRLRGSRSAREGIASELAICSVMPRASTAGSVISRPRKLGCLGAQPLVLNTNLDERLLTVSRAHAGCAAPDGWLTAVGNSPGRSNGIRIHRIG
jgi:hypothetical protein